MSVSWVRLMGSGVIERERERELFVALDVVYSA